MTTRTDATSETPSAPTPQTRSATTSKQAGPGQTHDASAREARAVAEHARDTSWRKPSFAKEMFLGRFRLDLVHPHPDGLREDAAEREVFLARLRAFCAEHVDPLVIEAEDRVPDDVIRGLARLGAFGIKIPREYGGLGFGAALYGRALMLVGSVHPTLAALLSAHQSIGVPEPVRLFGSPQQKQAYLPRCAAGGISAFLLTEPDVGSDPARLGTTAEPLEDGSGYLIDGVKLWTTNGVIAELLVVMARVPKRAGHRGGITAFVVEADAPGITVERRNRFMGLRGLENGLTRFHRVRVDASARIGEEGDGLRIALATLAIGRLSIPAVCAGSAKWAVKAARGWAAERVQWGVPVGKHAAVAHKIAYMSATAYALEAVFDLTAQLVDAGDNDVRIEAALAKLWASEAAWLVADDLVQIRGGRGYETAQSLRDRGERAVGAEQLLRDMRINRIFEGSTEIMHLLIAREAVDTHLQVAGDLIDPDADLQRKTRAARRAAGFYAGWFPRLLAGRGLAPRSYAEFGRLARHLRYVERTSRRLARDTFYGMARWQGRLERKQGFLSRVVDVGAELFAMTAVCVRAQAQGAGGLTAPDSGAAKKVPQGGAVEGAPAGGAIEHVRDGDAVDLADAFCRQARLRVEQHLRALWHNNDAVDERLARGVLDGRFSWVEAGILDPSEGTGPWVAEVEHRPTDVASVARRIG
jgi:alkylation response protein AidB-like acyl-CoA dehydrogenase